MRPFSDPAHLQLKDSDSLYVESSKEKYLPSWRSPELETIFGGALDFAGLTSSAAQRLVDIGARESELLDFKQFGAYASEKGKPDWSREQEFAKDVTAFANQRGGVLVLGVFEDGEIAKELRPQRDQLPGSLEQRLRLALANNAAPLPSVEMIPIEMPDGGYLLAIVVPPSLAAPHCVVGGVGGRRALHYPIRDGSNTRWMAEAEVAARYEGRGVARRSHEQRQAALIRDGKEALRRGADRWLYVATTPEVRAAAELSRSVAKDAQDWLHTVPAQSPFSSSLFWGSSIAIAGRGKMTFTEPPANDGEIEANPRYSYAELHVDGGAFVSIQLPHVPTAEVGVGEHELVNLLIQAVRICLEWSQRQVGTRGLATITSGFCQSNSSGDELPHGFALLSLGPNGHLRQMRRTRRLLIDPEVTTTADLNASVELQDKMAVTYQCAAALFQCFGVAEPTQLDVNGAMRPWGWGSNSRQQVERWALDMGLPIVGPAL